MSEDMTDTSFMDVDVEDAQELAIVDDNTEHNVSIADATPNPEKRYVLVRLDFHELELTQKLRHFLFFPKGEDDTEKKNRKKLALKKFYEAFNISEEERKDPTSWEGKVGHVLVGVEKDEDQIRTYGPSNNIRSFTLPRN